jgi:type II secretory ATPase GspE/PulE/Tfp pilus assembly ATPase PilB-like protein
MLLSMLHCQLSQQGLENVRRPRGTFAVSRANVANGMRVLRADGLRLIRAGLTTPEEVLRVAL